MYDWHKCGKYRDPFADVSEGGGYRKNMYLYSKNWTEDRLTSAQFYL